MAKDADIEQVAETRRPRVFISYAREDLVFVDRLVEALGQRGFETFLDRTDIHAFEDWWQRIEALIIKADTIVFILSPDAIASPICQKEVAFAVSLNKRIAPVGCRSVDIGSVPYALGRINFIFFDDETRFEERVDAVSEALSTDIEWIRQHTDFAQQARRWSEAGRPGPRGLLLRPPALEEAEKWIASRPPSAPMPTEATQAFVIESRRAATQRRRILSGSLLAGLLVALGLAGVAYWQRGVAIQQERIADLERKSAEEQRAIADQQRTVAQKNEMVAKNQRDQALLTQSRFLADLANQRSREGDAGTAALLVLEALPDKQGAVDRPYAPEAESALFLGLQRLQEVRVFSSHIAKINRASFSPDGRRIVTASDDRTARIWDAATGQTTAILSGHLDTMGEETSVSSAKFSPDGSRVLTASRDGSARIWETGTGKLVTVLNDHGSDLTDASFSPDGRRLVTSRDRMAIVWDVETGKVTTTLRGHRTWLQSADFSPDGRRIVTAATDVRIWDAQSGASVVVLKPDHFTSFNGAVFSPDGHQVATASDDMTVRLWDADTGKVIRAFNGHTGSVSSVSFSRKGAWLVSASKDRTARIWDVATGKVIGTLVGHADEVTSAAFSLDDRWLVTASADHTARTWKIDTDKTELVLGPPSRWGGYVRSARFSPDGQRVVTASNDQNARIWNSETGALIATLVGHTGDVNDAEFSLDGRNVVTASEDHSVRIWDVETGKTIQVVKSDLAGFVRATFSPDGRRILTASALGGTRGHHDGSARIWDVATGKSLVILDRSELVDATLSPDGRHVLVASSDVALLNAETGKEELILKGHTKRVAAVAFSLDGRQVATASDDQTARVWDVNTGATVAILLGHTAEVDGVAFSKDGQRVITSSADNTARLWDLKSGKAIAILSGHAFKVSSAAFDPEGRRVVTVAGTKVTNDNAARIWRLFLTAEELIGYSKQSVPRCLTRKQRLDAFLALEPPDWCIDTARWPYETQAWRDWLKHKREGANLPQPGLPE